MGAVSLLFSVRPAVDLRSVLAIAVLLFLTAFFMAGLAYGTSLILPNEAVYETVMNAIVLPVFFLSNALFPVDEVRGILGFLIRLNPFTYVIGAIRSLMLYGRMEWGEWILVVVMFLGMGGVSFGWAWRGMRREMGG